MAKIIINNRDLNFTIDTHGNFTGESAYESEFDYYEQLGVDPEVIDFDYDHKQIVKDLAFESVNILHNELVLHGDGVITGIDLVDSRSPQYYNYTTDSYDAEWTYNADKLRAYIEQNFDDVKQFISQEWRTLDVNWDALIVIPPVYIDDAKVTTIWRSDDFTVACIDYYTRQVVDDDSYFEQMLERENYIYYNNATLSDEMQQQLNKLGV